MAMVAICFKGSLFPVTFTLEEHSHQITDCDDAKRQQIDSIVIQGFISTYSTIQKPAATQHFFSDSMHHPKYIDLLPFISCTKQFMESWPVNLVNLWCPKLMRKQDNYYNDIDTKTYTRLHMHSWEETFGSWVWNTTRTQEDIRLEVKRIRVEFIYSLWIFYSTVKLHNYRFH